MQELLVATHNPGKKKEIAAILKGLKFSVLSLDDIDEDIPEADENGSSYEENALMKAREAAELSGLPTIADDSGLEVEVLPDELGVYTKRYADGTDADRNQKLLDALRQEEHREATFVCCIVLYDPSTKNHKTFFGEMHGKIAEEPRGEDGFGFDPIFIPDGYKKTNAQLGLKVKNKISHRAKAVKQLKEYLQAGASHA
ncbi:MAG TPA: RdgB/HAM1 family non-canonical purine NTP pyrophosphatase [Candidatus Saccharimonadia bacterium]|nr:RdgB/HAM1 family non-canonical purine NTP pyrophosphatase [Candidatus Saccharimonadia bacterium]